MKFPQSEHSAFLHPSIHPSIHLQTIYPCGGAGVTRSQLRARDGVQHSCDYCRNTYFTQKSTSKHDERYTQWTCSDSLFIKWSKQKQEPHFNCALPLKNDVNKQCMIIHSHSFISSFNCHDSKASLWGDLKGILQKQWDFLFSRLQKKKGI